MFLNVPGTFMVHLRTYQYICTNDKINKNIPDQEKGNEFRLDYNVCSRDGMFTNSQMFAVYDDFDTKKLIEALKSTLKK